MKPYSRYPIRILCSVIALSNLGSTIVRAQEIPTKIPTQTDIVKKGALHYFTRLPKQGWEKILQIGGFGDFNLWAHEQRTNGDKGPFRMFNSTQRFRVPSDENVLPFVNSASDFEDVLQVEFGVCAGFTVTQRRLVMLMHFDLENKEREFVPNKENDPEGWKKWMRSKIDQVMQLKMVIVPGFKNLREFASVPEVTRYLKETIVRQWELTNVNVLQGVLQGAVGVRKAMTKDELLKVQEKLSERLKFNYNPVVYLTKQNDNLFSTDQWIHVLQVLSITPKAVDGCYSFKVWDINEQVPTNALKEVKVDSKGIIQFDGQTLARVIPLIWDDFEIANMINNNLAFCTARPGFCTAKNL